MIDRRGFIVGTAAIAAGAALPSPALAMLTPDREFLATNLDIARGQLHRSLLQKLQGTAAALLEQEVYLATVPDPGLSPEEQDVQTEEFLKIALHMPKSRFRDKCIIRLEQRRERQILHNATVARLRELNLMKS